MHRKFVIAAVMFGFLPFSCPAQALSVGAGYALPGPVKVAPGQVIALFVSVPGKTAAGPVSAHPPLPTALGGFSVLLRQTFPSDPVPVPIQAVADSPVCSQLEPRHCDVVSMITVQVPFELTPNVRRARLPLNSARLDIRYGDAWTASLSLDPVADRIHILNSCDLISDYPGRACVAVVSHPDGSLVDSEHPALIGENLTITMVGLGRPGAAVATGAAAPSPAPPVEDVLVAFDTGANHSPSLPAGVSSFPAPDASLRPGAAGIYDVTFTVPALPAGTPACSSEVHSNLTVNIGRTASYDGAAICVDPQSLP